MSLTITVTEDQIMTALRSLLLLVVPAGVEVVQGQDNRVAEPANADYIVMTPITRVRSSTNVDTWAATALVVKVDINRGTMVTVQLDVYGPNSADIAQVVTTIWRDQFAVENVAGAVFAPCYASDGHQSPFVNGENQYENRWIISVVMHVKPSVVIDQQFASVVDIGLVEVDSLLQ